MRYMLSIQHEEEGTERKKRMARIRQSRPQKKERAIERERERERGRERKEERV